MAKAQRPVGGRNVKTCSLLWSHAAVLERLRPRLSIHIDKGPFPSFGGAISKADISL